MKRLAFLLACMATALVIVTPQLASATQPAAPEATPYDPARDAAADVAAAQQRAQSSGRLLLIVMGGNWCHDSRALAGWFGTPRFSAMLGQRYELVYVDVGHRDRNLELAERFGVAPLRGTPTVVIARSDGTALNAATAGGWRNAASRKANDIFRYFARFDPARSR